MQATAMKTFKSGTMPLIIQVTNGVKIGLLTGSSVTNKIAVISV